MGNKNNNTTKNKYKTDRNGEIIPSGRVFRAIVPKTEQYPVELYFADEGYKCNSLKTAHNILGQQINGVRWVIIIRDKEDGNEIRRYKGKTSNLIDNGANVSVGTQNWLFGTRRATTPHAFVQGYSSQFPRDKTTGMANGKPLRIDDKGKIIVKSEFTPEDKRNRVALKEARRLYYPAAHEAGKENKDNAANNTDMSAIGLYIPSTNVDDLPVLLERRNELKQLLQHKQNSNANEIRRLFDLLEANIKALKLMQQ